MKKNPRLGALENVSLAGVLVGSIASVISKQILFTTMPLSTLVVLGLFNRRRFEDTSRLRNAALAESDQKLANQLDSVKQQVDNAPSVEALHQLRQGLLMKDREVARRLYAEVTAVQQEMNLRFNVLEQQGLGTTKQEISQLEEQYQQLVAELAQLGADLQQFKTAQPHATETAIAPLKAEVTDLQSSLDSLNNQTKPNLTSLQEQISRLDRQFSKLPPPVDLSTLKQEVGELVRMITDLVPRRDLLTLVNEVRELHQKQESLKQSVVAIETSVVSFNTAFANIAPAQSPTAPLTDSAFVELEQHIAQLQLSEAADRTALQAEVTQYLEALRSQLASVQTFTETLAEQQQQLQTQLNHLPKGLDVVALQNQLRELSQRIPAAEDTLDGFRHRVQEVVQQELRFISQQLQGVSTAPDYELVFDLAQWGNDEASWLTGSRAILEEALESTQERLILILPWANQCSLNQVLLQKLEKFLDTGRRLDIGWCHLADRNDERLLKKIRRGWMTDLTHQDMMQETLHNLLHLKRAYSDQFQFKILGTSENFLVSDRTFAVLGIAEGLKTATAFSELQLKLRTRDVEVIQRLINRFDNPILEPDDLVAHWNRGVTRHDLSDKAGAIADYTQILQFNPEDAITHNYRAIAYYDSGDVARALVDLFESIRLHPQQAAAYCNRAFIYAEQGDPLGAVADYTQAIQNRPDWAIAYFYRGMAWQKLDKHQEAVTDYSEATYLTPDSAVAYYYRGLAWQKLRNYQGAIADLEIAADLFEARGSKTNAQKALKNIAKLRQKLSTRANGSRGNSSKVQEVLHPDEDPAGGLHSMNLFHAPTHPGHDSGTPKAAAPLTFQDLFGVETADRLFQETGQEG